MNKHRVILADGVEATRNSASRVYTHATVITVGADYEGQDSHGHRAGSEFVLVWHMTREAAAKSVRSSNAAWYIDHYKGSARIAEVELLPAKSRKAPAAKAAEPVSEPVVEAPAAPVQEAQAPHAPRAGAEFVLVRHRPRGPAAKPVRPTTPA